MILNAGIAVLEHCLTKDGHEMMFGTNHLGHYLLTALLQDLLLQSACARHVTVSSYGHKDVGKEQIPFDDIKGSKEAFDYSKYYGVSKISNIYFAKGLADRWGDKYNVSLCIRERFLQNSYEDFLME
eukprot:Mrub_10324.p1 GENE.Mrub_10324~~Mrub_10324.p1  ORF type:complete len:138 (-),score=17.60 Mrub_10324:276-656(-)